MIRNKNLIKAILLWLCSLSVMCTGVVSPALPIIKKSFDHLENAAILVKMMVVVPNLFIAIFSPIFGYVAVKFGKVRLLLVVLVIYACAGTTGAYLQSIHKIIFFRAILGISIAGIMTVATTLIADYFDSFERSSLVGMQTTVMSIGSTIFAMLSGVLADVNWHNIFYLYGMSLLILPFVKLFLVEPSNNHDCENGAHKTDKKIIQNNFVIFLVCMINLVTMTAFYMIPLQLPFLLYNDPYFVSFGINAKKVAFAISCQVIVAAMCSLRYRRLKKSRDFAVMCALGFGFMAMSYILVSHAHHYFVVIAAMLLCGVGMGLMMPNSTLWIISITEPKKRPLFLGLFTTSTFAGKFLSPIVAAPLIYFSSIRTTFAVYAFFMLFIAILAMYLNDYFKRINRVLYRHKILNSKSQLTASEVASEVN